MTAQAARDLIMLAMNHPLLIKIQKIERGTSWLHISTGKLKEGQDRIYLFNP
jgi:hypothetical protein